MACDRRLSDALCFEGSINIATLRVYEKKFVGHKSERFDTRFAFNDRLDLVSLLSYHHPDRSRARAGDVGKQATLPIFKTSKWALLNIHSPISVIFVVSHKAHG